MATGISNFTISSSGNNVNFSFTWEGFTCLTNQRIVVSLIDTASSTSVAALEYTSGIGTVGTITGSFSSIYNGIFYAIARFICDGTNISSYTSNTLTHSTSSVPAPSAPPSAPTSGPSSVSSGNVNANGNSSFCINTGGTNISFSSLNTLFGRNASTPNTSLSGLFNPSRPPSLIGLSFLPLNAVTPGKLTQNAVSEFRGTCSYGAPNEYFFALIVTPIFNNETVLERNFEGVWVHSPSGNVTNFCPFNNSVVRITATIRVQDQYGGSTVPSPYSVTTTRIQFAGGSTNFTTTRAANSLGITTDNHDISLSYRDRVVGVLAAQSNVVGFNKDFDVRVQVTSPGPNQLASVGIGVQSNLEEIRVTRTLVPIGNFNYEWQHSVSGGITSSTLSISSVFSNTISSSTQTGSGNSNQTGNRTVSIAPTPSSGYTTLVIYENSLVIYNSTQLGSQSTTVNFQSGVNYRIEGISTTAIQ